MPIRDLLATLLFRATLLAALASAGCSGPRYYKVVTMDTRGDLVASWIAKGRVLRRDGGYRFTAIERQIPHPPRVYRYPLGFRTFVKTPETVIYRTEPPPWYRAAQPLVVADAAEARFPLFRPSTPPRPITP
jgi:hypothetical protein